MILNGAENKNNIIKHTGMILIDLQIAFDALDYTILFRQNEAH